jgi:hypothetical protein
MTTLDLMRKGTPDPPADQDANTFAPLRYENYGESIRKRAYPSTGFAFSPVGVVIVLLLMIIVAVKLVKLNYP